MTASHKVFIVQTEQGIGGVQKLWMKYHLTEMQENNHYVNKKSKQNKQKKKKKFYILNDTFYTWGTQLRGKVIKIGSFLDPCCEFIL